jgi:molybdenum cofactor biosynthesis enzyme MoaA
MKIQTFTIVTGSSACNARCPYCVSEMTGKELSIKEPAVNWQNFSKACRLAQVNNVSTVLFTGKGEPTLFPDQITKFLQNMNKFDFPLIELQTNALVFGREFEKYKKYLEKWKELGLNTIAISIAHYKKEKNKEIYTPNSDYINLAEVISNLHKIGYSIRLSCIMLKGFIDDINELKNLIEFCKNSQVEQLTIRSVKAPEKTQDKKIYDWTKKHVIKGKQIQALNKFIEKTGKKLMTLSFGAVVYDVGGQNVCSSDCLTIKPETDELRQLIFFPDGHLRYDWQYKGAILI